MTGGDFYNLVQELLQQENGSYAHPAKLSVPNLMHIKAGIDRALLDAISDDETPCPHDGTRWTPSLSENPGERCGQCGRVIEEIKA